MTQEEKIKFFLEEIKKIVPVANICLNKKQLALVLDTSVVTIDRRIKASYGIPEPVKGESEKSRIYWTVLDTAIFLAGRENKIKVA